MNERLVVSHGVYDFAVPTFVYEAPPEGKRRRRRKGPEDVIHGAAEDRDASTRDDASSHVSRSTGRRSKPLFTLTKDEDDASHAKEEGEGTLNYGTLGAGRADVAAVPDGQRSTSSFYRVVHDEGNHTHLVHEEPPRDEGSEHSDDAWDTDTAFLAVTERHIMGCAVRFVATAENKREFTAAHALVAEEAMAVSVAQFFSLRLRSDTRNSAAYDQQVQPDEEFIRLLERLPTVEVDVTERLLFARDPGNSHDRTLAGIIFFWLGGSWYIFLSLALSVLWMLQPCSAPTDNYWWFLLGFRGVYDVFASTSMMLMTLVLFPDKWYMRDRTYNIALPIVIGVYVGQDRARPRARPPCPDVLRLRELRPRRQRGCRQPRRSPSTSGSPRVL